jgi:hypothetical protein
VHVVDRTWIRVPGPVFAQQEIRPDVVDCMCKYDDTESHRGVTCTSFSVCDRQVFVFFPTPGFVRIPGGLSPQRLTASQLNSAIAASVKIARARNDRFWRWGPIFQSRFVGTHHVLYMSESRVQVQVQVPCGVSPNGVSSWSPSRSYSFRCVSSSPSTLTLLSPIALTPTASLESTFDRLLLGCLLFMK